MRYMLDTNICISAIRRKPTNVLFNLLNKISSDICISVITYSELIHGVEKSRDIDQNRLALTMFLSEIEIIPYDTQDAEEYGRIRADLEKQGTPIGPMDMLFAAHAKSRGCILVTNNTREFERVKNLQLEDWTK
jgi:tRNA(fMet)-specific endonuclease VapC